MADPEGWTRVGGADLPPGAMRAESVQGLHLALFHLEDGSWRVIDNVCTHGRAFLTEGWLDGEEIECPLHAGRFNVVTGAALYPPVEVALRVYPTRIEDGVVFAQLGT